MNQAAPRTQGNAVVPATAAGKQYPRGYIENHRKLSENRLPARTLLLPAQKRGITHKNFTASDRIRLLSGDWKFSFLQKDTDAPFYLPGASDEGWDRLPVPSMWQFHGYASCFYPNVRYCFPYDPPFIHCGNPVGLYRKSFHAAKKEGRQRAFLRFLGVDNAFFVWLNGSYVGFSKGSRIPAEFDVTDVLQDGENLLAVKVYTFSDASYLENQDMLMASGIFRDVMLIYTGENTLWDYTIVPSSAGFSIRCESLTNQVPAILRCTLCDAAGAVCAETETALSGSDSMFLPLKNAVLWNAETPYLYTLYIELVENGVVIETHTKKVGVANSEIRGNQLLMNGSPITLKGVNRHENNARSGRAITAAQIERELKDIKDCNLNAIRCSHYTNHPLFYELCSELGIYVMDEADCETHGAECTGDQGALNQDDTWFDAFFDRVSRMYAINKNETCINIWSLGNECGAGQNAEKCISWLNEQAVHKPIKDNSASGGAAAQFSLTGYMPMQTLRNSDPSKGPLLMLEYGHAMGNSPGGLQDIWNWVYENEQCCGGYVWEYKSHGFYAEGKNGRARYLYGGDFDDVYHWSNFSLDGYHTSDGKPKPSWHELREVSAPVFVRWKTDGIDVKNTLDFKTLTDIILRWSVNADGKTIRRGEIVVNDLSARVWRSIPLPLETKGLCGLITADCVFCQQEKILAHKQTILADLPESERKPEAFPHTVHVGEHLVSVSGDAFLVEITDGLLSKLESDCRVLFNAPMHLNCFRAPTDNDGAIFAPNHGEMWKERLLDSMCFGCHTVETSDAPEAVTVTAVGKYLPFSHFWGFDTTIRYRICSGGTVDISFDLIPYGKDLPDLLPRVGTVFTLAGDYARCEWLGRGPGENYPDCKANAPVGIYQACVGEMNYSYDVPQETGNHEDCRYVTVYGNQRAITAEGKFSFSFHDFSLRDLSAARHCDELEKSTERYLYIDHRQRGLGSHSCGPEPEAEYELPLSDFHWGFRLIPGERRKDLNS